MMDFVTKTLMRVGGVMMICAAALTVGDIIARKLLSIGLLGLVDITQFGVIGFAFLSMPRAFHLGAHVSIELYDHRLSWRADAALKVVALTLGCLVLALLCWFGWIRLNRVWGYGDISQNIGIPMWIYWAMFWIGVTGSALVCLHHLVGNLLMVFSKKSDTYV